jgi:uncharacterized HAD superfamily protein
VNPESQKLLEGLHKLNYYNVLITARKWHPDGERITYKWVEDNDLEVDEIIFVGVNDSKTDAIRSLKNIKFSIDDRIKHCREYTQSDMVEHVLVKDAPWNTHMTRWNEFWGGYDYDARINSLDEVLTTL